MGNSIKNDLSFGTISIKIDKKSFHTGEQINGFVNLNMRKPFPSPNLFFQVQGIEHTQGVDYYTTTGKFICYNSMYFIKVV
jgi:hypothetical protein